MARGGKPHGYKATPRDTSLPHPAGRGYPLLPLFSMRSGGRMEIPAERPSPCAPGDAGTLQHPTSNIRACLG